METLNFLSFRKGTKVVWRQASEEEKERKKEKKKGREGGIAFSPRIFGYSITVECCPDYCNYSQRKIIGEGRTCRNVGWNGVI